MLEIDRSEWLASQFLKETMGSPISRPRQVANTRPCTASAHPFVHQDCSFKTASPVVELTARLVLDIWLRRSAPVTHQDQGFGHSAVMRLVCKGAGVGSCFWLQAAIFSNQITLQLFPIKREKLSIK